MAYTWIEFKNAVDALLMTNADRDGTQTAKALKVKLGAKKLQESIPSFRLGHQDIYEFADLTASGGASIGELPEDAEVRDIFFVGVKVGTVSAVASLTDDTLTVVDHGITSADDATLIVTGVLKSTGDMLGGAESNRSYYIRVVDEDTITLHTSAQGAVDNTYRLDITSAGSGVITLEHSLLRVPVNKYPWSLRTELTDGTLCWDQTSGLIAFDPNSREFIIFPMLEPTADSNDRFWHIEVNWSGVKLEWDDNDTTPFNDQAVEAVSEYVNGFFAQMVDKDLQAASAHKQMFRSTLTTAYLQSKRQREQNP